MGKILNYKLLGTALKSLSDACFKADEQLIIQYLSHITFVFTKNSQKSPLCADFTS